jgi:hypothetical protein
MNSCNCVQNIVIFHAHLSDQYNEILMTECCAQFERLLASDNYTPMVVSNEEEFRAVITRFPFYKRGLEQVTYMLSYKNLCLSL